MPTKPTCSYIISHNDREAKAMFNIITPSHWEKCVIAQYPPKGYKSDALTITKN